MDLADAAEPVEIRVKQAKALAKDPSPQALDALLSGLESKDEDIHDAIKAALEARQAGPELLARAADGSMPTSKRVAALAGLRVLKPDAGGAVGKLLADPDVLVRSAAALALCVFGAEQAEAALVSALPAEASSKVRYFLATALGGLKSEAAKRAITKQLASDADPVVQDALQQAQRRQARA